MLPAGCEAGGRTGDCNLQKRVQEKQNTNKKKKVWELEAVQVLSG